MGDSNIDLIDTCVQSKIKESILNLLKCFGFKDNFIFPTRVTLDSSTCINNIVINVCIEREDKCNLELGLYDH